MMKLPMTETSNQVVEEKSESFTDIFDKINKIVIKNSSNEKRILLLLLDEYRMRLTDATPFEMIRGTTLKSILECIGIFTKRMEESEIDVENLNKLKDKMRVKYSDAL